MISKWWSKDERTLAPRLELCSNPAKIACWYRYQKCTGALLLWGTGTSLFGTGTTASLYVGTGTIMCGTGTTASANVPPHRSTTRGFSTTAAINRNDLHLFFGHEPLQKVCTELEKLAQAKNARDDQRHLFLHKMGAKHEIGVLKSYINVALLCIQRLTNNKNQIFCADSFLDTFLIFSPTCL